MAGTAKGLWGVYSLFSIACAVAFWLGGMAPLDAVMHMFATVSFRGAVAPRCQIFGFFQSPLLEGIALIFMLLASCNFASVLALRKGNWRTLWNDPEIRATIGVLLGGGVLVALLLWAKGVYGPLEALSYGVCTVVSVATHHRLCRDRLPDVAGVCPRC